MFNMKKMYLSLVVVLVSSISMCAATNQDRVKIPARSRSKLPTAMELKATMEQHNKLAQIGQRFSPRDQNDVFNFVDHDRTRRVAIKNALSEAREEQKNAFKQAISKHEARKQTLEPFFAMRYALMRPDVSSYVTTPELTEIPENALNKSREYMLLRRFPEINWPQILNKY
jgi:predicted Zn-dependent protease